MPAGLAITITAKAASVHTIAALNRLNPGLYGNNMLYRHHNLPLNRIEKALLVVALALLIASMFLSR